MTVQIECLLGSRLGPRSENYTLIRTWTPELELSTVSW